MDSIFMVCKMWSAYLYGMNNRPFNSGANFTNKKRLLEIFSQTSDIESPVFRKYLHRIAKDWKMPCDSRAETQAIFDNVLQMDSFNKKSSQPKQANWFAWNKAALPLACPLARQWSLEHSLLRGAQNFFDSAF